MGTEHTLVPEWLRQGHGGSHQSQAHHRYHGDGGGPGTPGRHSNRNSDPPLRHSGSYTPPGRRNLGPDRATYDRSSSFRSSLSSDAERHESQGRGQDTLKQSPEGKPHRSHERGNFPSRGGSDQTNEGGSVPVSGPSLPTAMPTSTGSLASNVQKAAFERNFPVLGDKFGRFMPSLSSVPSPRRQSSVEGGEGWTSRLADVPSPGTGVNGFRTGGVNGPYPNAGVNGFFQSAGVNGASLSAGVKESGGGVNGLRGAGTSGLVPGAGVSGPGSPALGEGHVRTPRMAEALQQAMQEQQQKLTCNAPSDGQKQEELVMKKMKQLIPLKPTMPKNLLLKPSKKPLHSSTPQPAPPAAKPVVRRLDDASGFSARSSVAGPAAVATLGRLQIPGTVSILATAPPTPPSPAGNGTTPKPSGITQKRNDFFKGLRKKALSPKERAPEGNDVAGDAGARAAGQGLETSLRRLGSLGTTSNGRAESRGTSNNLPEEAPSIRSSNGAVDDLPVGTRTGHVNGAANGLVSATKEHGKISGLENGAETPLVLEGLQNGVRGEGLRNGGGDVEVVADPEEEEAAFLRSLGWTGPENDDEEGALTEEEIRAFFSQTANLNIQPKVPYQNGAQTFEPTSPVHVAFSVRPRVSAKVEAIVGSYSSLSSGLSSSDDESDY